MYVYTQCPINRINKWHPRRRCSAVKCGTYHQSNVIFHPSLNINTVLYWYTDMVLVQSILDPYYIKKSLYNVGSSYCGMRFKRLPQKHPKIFIFAFFYIYITVPSVFVNKKSNKVGMENEG